MRSEGLIGEENTEGRVGFEDMGVVAKCLYKKGKGSLLASGCQPRLGVDDANTVGVGGVA
jgi:hypothetical protein